MIAIIGVPEQMVLPIAFHSKLANNAHIHPGMIIKFQTKTLDTSTSYNQSEGVYVVPESGIYVFTWTLNTGGHTQAVSKIMINEHAKGHTIADSEENNDMRTSTGILVASVNMGDRVHIELSNIAMLKGFLEVNYGQCSFSGWKLT